MKARFRQAWPYPIILSLAEFSREALILIFIPFFVTQDLHQRVWLAGAAVSAHYLADTIAKSPAGFLADRYGGNRILRWGLALSTVTVAALGWLHSTTELIALGFILGLGTAPSWPLVVAGYTSGVDPVERGAALGEVFTAWLIGAGAGPVLTTFLIGRHPGQVRWLFPVVFLLALLLSKRLPADPPPHVALAPKPSPWPHVRAVGWLLPGMLVQTASLGLLVPVAALYAESVLGLSSQRYGWLLVGGGTLTVLLMRPLGLLTGRLGSRPILTLGFALASLGLWILTVTRSYFLLILDAGLIGAAYAMILPSWGNLLAERVPEEIRGTMWGVFMTVEGIGLAVGAFLGARLYEFTGQRVPFEVAAVVTGLLAVIYLLSRLATSPHRPAGGQSNAPS